ncbi:hypothetical protein jhhlp_008821 [Lomentospora prolificans]|uniref:SMP-30/Gluconolactonase/LRE-like region domain-containing protein n=1 Tax=Lomentospora prolificans TaxID=41688 RepID=A0A2N3MZ58_9PEZI|nr:hypothetical protein jhhlp_008821 [Lomentospora prolificans]
MKPILHSFVGVAFSAAVTHAALNITYFNNHTADTIAPARLPLPGSSSQSEEIIRQFTALGRSTTWNLVEKVDFEGSTWEPEGIVRVGADRYYVSAGEYVQKTEKYPHPINGNDRTTGIGFAHMIVFDGKGRRVADASISKEGETEYHNGGIDYDGTYIWATLSEYRPNSTATVVRMRPSTLEPESILRVRDHQGGVVHDLSTGNLVTLNWGSRQASLWSLNYPREPLPEFTTPLSTTKNPSNWIDYQDCKFLGHSKTYDYRAVMMCSGIADIGGGDGQQEKVRIGGVAIVDMLTMVPLADVPIAMVTDKGAAMAKNPFDVALVDGKLRLYFLPDEEHSTLYVYEAK